MSIDIMRISCLRLRLWFIYFENRVTNYVGYFAKVWKKHLKSMGWRFLICLARRCSILFSTLMFMPVVPVILTRN